MENNKLNTFESYRNEGFKIIRNGEVITLTKEEICHIRDLELSSIGRDCIQFIIDCCDYSKQDLKVLENAMDDMIVCREIEQRIIDIVFEDSGEIEYEVVNNFLTKEKERKTVS